MTRPADKTPAKPAHVPVTAKLDRTPSLGKIKTHTSSSSSASLGAEAFTKGSDKAIKGPKGPAHQPIVAHELAHVVQQKHGRVSKPQK